MFSPQRKLVLLAMFCGILFSAGLTQLFLLRFEAGNVYPIYSSLRTDPLGTRALFEGYERMPSATVDRNFRPWHRFRFDGKTTLMIIGLPDTRMGKDADVFKTLLENLAQSGGRLVLTMAGASSKCFPKDQRQWNSDPGKEGDIPHDADPIEVFVEPEAPDDNTSTCDDTAFGDDLKTLGLGIKAVRGEPIDEFAALFADRPDILPLNIPWRSQLFFAFRDNSWETLYTWQDRPVLAQRPWGNGTVVIATDSYLLSNEAMRNNRRSGLLTWLAVPGSDIIFDEYHKGLVKQPGVAGLTRQYRLHGFFAAIVAVAVLFIWRQSAIFVPTVQTEQEAEQTLLTIGKDTGQGMVHLTRQHIRPNKLLTVCFETWKVQAAQRVSPSLIAEVEALVHQAAGDSRKAIQVQTYQQICQLLKQGKRI